MKWISVKERLPRKEECPLLTYDGVIVSCHNWYDFELAKWQTILEIPFGELEEAIEGEPDPAVTHFMSYPEQPK